MKKALAIFALIVTLMVPLPAAAQVDVFPQCSTSGSDSAICRGGESLFGPSSIWNRILNAITYVAGAVAVLMIIVGGLRYTLSNGDQAGINAAKNTILYSVIGLVLTIMANAIINFVLINI
ncbi:MAG: pilin [Candidatus Woesebacteria bacterium]|jgi:hypothetical protein